jgi:hypothetical protein
MPPGADSRQALRRIIWREIKWSHTIILKEGDSKKLVVVVMSEEITELRYSATQCYQNVLGSREMMNVPGGPSVIRNFPTKLVHGLKVPPSVH